MACDKILACGQHRCTQKCHAGACSPCTTTVTLRCWCATEEQVRVCGELEGDSESRQRFDCGGLCSKMYTCGIHTCKEPCHSEHKRPFAGRDDTQVLCPYDPSTLTHCPCGKHPLQSPFPFIPVSSSIPLPRTSCSDPIPTCGSTCDKPLAGCSHVCKGPCHLGPCPPCSTSVQQTCRCGSRAQSVLCSVLNGGTESEFLCNKPCTSMRACGRHQCNRLCCPLAGFGTSHSNQSGKGKKRRLGPDFDVELAALGELSGLHECDLVCGKPLACGKHFCEAADHKGPCGPCLRSSFEEMICHCTRTILDPPIPCGTQMRCPFPCARPLPPCGHPRVPHTCHGLLSGAPESSDDESHPAQHEGDGPGDGTDDAPHRRANANERCPPCPHLVSKMCACGKKMVDNVKCFTATEKVRCGGVCGKSMACGFHHCERICHADPCGDCTAPCGKARKSCLPEMHPCTQPCHAPAACSETEPCQALVSLTCACGRLKQAVQCGRRIHAGATGPSKVTHSAQPKCNNDCLLAQRNARLASALGIDSGARAGGSAGGEAVYNDELVGFARVNAKFLALVEKTFAEFIQSGRKSQVLPHMPPERRKFVHDLANVYRMDTQMVDQEPNRSVQLLGRLDTRTPTPLLSVQIATLAPKQATPNFGKLADVSLRAGSNTSSWRASPAVSAAPSRTVTPHEFSDSKTKGWTSVVAPSSRSMNTSPAPAWGAVKGAGKSNGNSNATTAVGVGIGCSGTGRGVVRAGSPLPSRSAGGEGGEDAEVVPQNWEDEA
ncbi:hypothetical protein HGRIS_000344 [Hohenbuehelia grisea]